MLLGNDFQRYRIGHTIYLALPEPLFKESRDGICNTLEILVAFLLCSLESGYFRRMCLRILNEGLASVESRGTGATHLFYSLAQDRDFPFLCNLPVHGFSKSRAHFSVALS